MTPTAPTSSSDAPIADVGKALGTDYFLIRPELSDSERDYLDRARRFVEEEALPVINDYWERAELPVDLLRRIGELGLVGDGIAYPGVPEMSPIAAGLINMELNRGDGSLGTAVGVQAGLAMRSIAMLGSEEQKQAWLPPMARMEKFGAFALTEPDHGSDSVALETTARSDGDEYVISGSKRWIGFGSVADVAVVWARDAEDGQVKGFLVEPAKADGYHAEVITGKAALRAVWQAAIELRDVRVPAANLLPGARSFKDTARVLKSTRQTCAWAALGHAVAAYDAALSYARSRHQFGKPLVSFQMVQERLVQMLAEVTAMQLYCLRIGRLMESDELSDTIAALAKLNNTVKARGVIAEARNLLGGNGLLLEYHVIRHMTDIEAIYTYEGTEAIQTLLVGRDITGVGSIRMNTESMSKSKVATNGQSRTARAGLAARSGLDVMLTEAAAGGPPRFLAPGPGVKVGAGLARHPHRVAARVNGLVSELGRAATGRSELAPAKGDRRFADPAWEGNWLLRRLLQGYLAVSETVDGLISDADADWRAERQARLAASNLLDALAPTNFPWSNPVVIREIVNTGGGNLVRGARRFARDLSTPPRLPATVDTSKFEVGGNLAVTPGSVVLRTEVFELIQYKPSTDEVREVPLLFVPPTINKYYILDISPERSMIEHFVGLGQQVFAISWRNPDQEQGHFDFDTYAEAVSEARAAIAAITGSDSAHLAAACSGGLITTGLVGATAARGDLGNIASLTLMVCALDNETEGTMSALTTRDLAAAAVAESARKGYVDGQALAGVFTWLRPNDLVWSYVVNNYLLGKTPPAFDILYWNQDTVRLSAGLHRDFIHIGIENSFTQAGALEVLGEPVDLGKVTIDTYSIAGLNDHIVPWQSAYRGAQLFGGTHRFVLSSSGHIQALVNPPGRAGAESRSSYRVADELPETADEFLAQAPKVPGSWWPDWDQWLAKRSGELKPAPKTLGSRGYKAHGKAPGTYVLAG